jgi:hypothetical protein
MVHTDDMTGVRFQVDQTIRHLLSQQDRDPHSPSYGCFDRKYWAWKLVDFPEATFQRNIHAMALSYKDTNSPFCASPVLQKSILAGLTFAAKIQHRNGSFDQAFPNEQSFGATAFLLHALGETFLMFSQDMDKATRGIIEKCLRRAADFICDHDEEHGYIANHLSGAVLSLLVVGRYFESDRYHRHAEVLLDSILSQQSKEGWFLEYEGADPGYQTLCLYYLAQVYRIQQSNRLRKALESGLEFIAHFVHPDGTFAGEYGSRRTAIFYPGGVALLVDEFPLAVSVFRAMNWSIRDGKTVTLLDVDIGNIAPLICNYACALQTVLPGDDVKAPMLPWEQPKIVVDFREAGIHIRGTEQYYAVVGVSNGGTLKVFDKRSARVLCDDGGYAGQLADGTVVSTQVTSRGRCCGIGENQIDMAVDFYEVLNTMPTPVKFLLLRVLNLTLMHNASLSNWVKKRLVRLLISGRHKYAIRLERRIRFEKKRITVHDRVEKSQRHKLVKLECGRPFSGIHMASAKYFEGSQLDRRPPVIHVDVAKLNRQRFYEIDFVIEGAHA